MTGFCETTVLLVESTLLSRWGLLRKEKKPEVRELLVPLLRKAGRLVEDAGVKVEEGDTVGEGDKVGEGGKGEEPSCGAIPLLTRP
jgi:hypothetical protein